jgi:hypothetical protein
MTRRILGNASRTVQFMLWANLFLKKEQMATAKDMPLH